MLTEEGAPMNWGNQSLPARFQRDGRSGLPRFSLLLDAQVTADGDAVDVVVHNLSQGGMLVECDADLDIGDPIEIDLSADHRAQACVMWHNENFYGCRFDSPISAAVLGAARLRSAPRLREDEDDLDASGAGGGDAEASDVEGASLEGEAQESLARRLRRLRKQNGFSQGELAERIGVSKPTVWAWEHGRARPQEARLKGIADALGTTIDDLDGLPRTDNLAFLMAEYRDQIAAHFNVAPAKVKIVIEF
jgi:transcriptional regulator with XRE-family HTH domain